LQLIPVRPDGHIQIALPFNRVAHVAFAVHGILEHGFAISQLPPVKPAGHVHAYDVLVEGIQVPPLRHGAIIPDVTKHGLTISQ
jgi:hypothetical protein